MPNAIATDHATVLQAVVDRLIDQVGEFTPSTCFVSLTPEPAANVHHNLFCTVSPLDGNYRDSEFVGAGTAFTVEDTGAQVTIWSAMKLDRVEHDKYILVERDRGLLIVKKKVLKALAAHDLKNAAGSSLLVDLMQPIHAPRPDIGGRDLGNVVLTFATPFYWDLT